MEDFPFPPFIPVQQTTWLHCIACDCLTDGSAAFVDEAGLVRCAICGTPIMMGWDDGD